MLRRSRRNVNATATTPSRCSVAHSKNNAGKVIYLPFPFNLAPREKHSANIFSQVGYLCRSLGEGNYWINSIDSASWFGLLAADRRFACRSRLSLSTTLNINVCYNAFNGVCLAPLQTPIFTSSSIMPYDFEVSRMSFDIRKNRHKSLNWNWNVLELIELQLIVYDYVVGTYILYDFLSVGFEAGHQCYDRHRSASLSTLLTLIFYPHDHTKL